MSKLHETSSLKGTWISLAHSAADVMASLDEAHRVETSVHWRSRSEKQVVLSEMVKYTSIPTHAIPRDLYKTDTVTST